MAPGGAWGLVCGDGGGGGVVFGGAGGASFGLGLRCELLQRVLSIPVVEWEDVGDDAVGAAVGWAVLTVWRRWRVE
ncbi:MAG: hypothetical protein INH40_20835 [Acidobacteriaceae bacterium]|nr:hypothetical protein [Acidobacteriaceae bacterium]